MSRNRRSPPHNGFQRQPRSSPAILSNSRFSSQVAQLTPQVKWQESHEMPFILTGLARNETTYNVFRHFSVHGNIDYIQLFEDNGGIRNGRAKITFRPPPEVDFWSQGTYVMETGEEPHVRYQIRVSIDTRDNRQQEIRSPIRPGVKYRPIMQIRPGSLHFGIMLAKNSMMPLHTLSDNSLSFCVDLIKHRILVTFDVKFTDPLEASIKIQATTVIADTQEQPIGKYNRVNTYRFEIPFGQLDTISQFDLNENVFALSISLESPPRYFRRRQEPSAGHSKETSRWSEFDTWFRQTDVVYDPFRLHRAKIALHKEVPVLDIGRWTTFVFEFNKPKIDMALFSKIKEALQDYNIKFVETERWERQLPHEPELWTLIDRPVNNGSGDMSSLAGDAKWLPLPFEVRYQLEVCISREIINEYNIDAAFVEKLADMASEDPVKARNLLEYVAGQEDRIYEPLNIFDNKDALAFSPKSDVPHYCAYVRKATITPTTIYFSSPTVETTNRVLRHYAQENRDGRFLRGQFTDEMFEGRINSSAERSANDELFTRVYRTLFNGIQIGDRHYKFLAFGNSQFRENGAYFFCETEHLTCDDIRRWMGNFSDISIVAKYAARLGQCFSTTRAIKGLTAPEIVKIADVERGKYCFTDGVGKISPFLAQYIAADLGLRANLAPSAFQFRLGGCKGILAVWPEAKNKEVHIRKSQQKFVATYNGLEIIRCAQFGDCNLNRQTITILSSLGVPDQVFLDMLVEQLVEYETVLDTDENTLKLLYKVNDDYGMTSNIAAMVHNGFMANQEPFVMSLLHLWRSWSIKLLKEKARIRVDNGAFLLGCVDETGTLRGYSKPTAAQGEQFAEEDQPQIFVQIPDKADATKYIVIEGICLIGRNPSLHPGDLRVVQAVNVPALHHLRDVVVFPLNGERDIPSMCSGGDLDGDDFFVIWEPKLRPPEWNCEPMNYDAPKPKQPNKPVEITDLMKFFVRFMKNDSLPTIAHAHLAQSDFQRESVKTPQCLELAALHSKAVDYVKTGEAAQMPKRLKPQMWPHFMEKKFKSKDQTYHSGRVLGQLFDKVDTVAFVPQWDMPFDKRILRAYRLQDSVLKLARQIKSKYDTHMKRVMANQDIKTEFEVWSSFALTKPRVGSDYKQQEEIIRQADGLKEQFRAICIEAAGSKDFSDLGPFVAAMYKVTKEELDIAIAERRERQLAADREGRILKPRFMPLISFPWLFERILGRIATGVDMSDDLAELGLEDLALRAPAKKRGGAGVTVDTEDHITQEDGVIVHRGEVLDLFREEDYESDIEGTYDDDNEHGFMTGRSGEVVLATEFDLSKLVLDNLRGGTGLEDVVPVAEMEGLISPQQTAAMAYENQAGSSMSPTDWHFIQKPKVPTPETGSDGSGYLPRSSSPSNAPESDEEVELRMSPLEALSHMSASSEQPKVTEENVEIALEKSLSEKLSQLNHSEDKITGSRGHHVEEEEVEIEEEISIDTGANSFEKLSQLITTEKKD